MGFHSALLFVLVGATQPISGGHFNPMVSTMMAVWGNLPWTRLPLYVAAQLLGSALGSAAQFYALPPEMQDVAHAAVQVLSCFHEHLYPLTVSSNFAAAVLCFGANTCGFQYRCEISGPECESFDFTLNVMLRPALQSMCISVHCRGCAQRQISIQGSCVPEQNSSSCCAGSSTRPYSGPGIPGRNSSRLHPHVYGMHRRLGQEGQSRQDPCCDGPDNSSPHIYSRAGFIHVHQPCPGVWSCSSVRILAASLDLVDRTIHWGPIGSFAI